jgi:hypothetical protein
LKMGLVEVERRLRDDIDVELLGRRTEHPR